MTFAIIIMLLHSRAIMAPPKKKDDKGKASATSPRKTRSGLRVDPKPNPKYENKRAQKVVMSDEESSDDDVMNTDPSGTKDFDMAASFKLLFERMDTLEKRMDTVI